MVSTLFIGQNLLEYQELPSTNVAAAELTKNEKPVEGTTIIAYNQTHGKGHRGNHWESEPGKNLTFSVILYPNATGPSEIFLFSQAISLGVLNFLNTFGVIGFTIKWPNDLYYHNKKIGGILIENAVRNGSILQSVVGIGLNLNQLRFNSSAPNPLSLRKILGHPVPSSEAFPVLLSCIEAAYLKFQNREFQEIRSAYEKNLFLFGVPHFFTIHHQKVKLIIKGTDHVGNLVLVNSKGEESKYGYKEIVFNPLFGN